MELRGRPSRCAGRKVDFRWRAGDAGLAWRRMKNFFASFFASLTALLVFFGGGLLVLVLLIAALAAASGEKKVVTVAKGSYLVLNLSGNIQDSPDQAEGLEELMEALGGEAGRRVQLRQLTRALEAAAADDAIAGVFLRGSLAPAGYGSGYAALREVRAALETFRASGKPVKAYLSTATVRDYYLAAAASEVVLDPYGLIFMPGLAAQPMFYAGAFEKFGIGVQVTRVGKYKSAVEPFTRRDMSPESRAQTQQLLDDVWGELVAGIEQARGLEAGTLQPLVDAEGLIRPASALEHKLVDRVAYWDELLDNLKADTGRTGSKQTFKQVALKDYARLVSGDGATARRHESGKVALGSSRAGKVAIVYAEGTIVDGTGHEEGLIYGDKLARELRKLRLDDSIKAVVLRVNSPGGSASASETIQRELRLIRKDKPVVVSMGTVAASGGYWISTAADRVFAEPTTITGSIGVFGMFLNFQELATAKLGLGFDAVKTGKLADLLTVTRPKTAEELAVFQHYVDWIYDEFITRVAEARSLAPDAVREIAQGRVWSGAEALKLGLVDEMGGLAAAVKFAATKAGLGSEFRVAEYPRKKQFAEQFAEAFDPRKREPSAGGVLGAWAGRLADEWRVLTRLHDPRGAYALLPFDISPQ